MDSQWPLQKTSERLEPISITLADLMMLVFGSAVAISLPQMHFPADRIAIDNIPMPGWVPWLFVIGEVAMKVGLALIPVILGRRARYGGLPRPADWLAILVGLSLLHEIVRRYGCIKRFARWYLVDFRSWLGYSISFPAHERLSGGRNTTGDHLRSAYEGFPVGFTAGDEYRIWGLFTAVLFLSISTALVFGWKRIPGWVKTGLLAAAALTLPTSVSYLLTAGLVRAAQVISGRIALPATIAVQIARGVGTLPEGILFGVPTIATLRDIGRGGIGNWLWTARLGAMIALVALLSGSAIYWYADLVNRTNPLVPSRLIVRAVTLVVVVLTSWAIVKRFGSASTNSNRS